MQVAELSQFTPHRVFPHLRPLVRKSVCCGAFLALSPLAARAAEVVAPVDLLTIVSLQQRAHSAPPQEQAQMFADLADKISLLAGKEIAEGDAVRAEATLKQLETCTAEIEIGLQKNSKGLKKTEMMLHTTQRRLASLVRSASGDLKPMVQSALKRLDKVQTALLGAIFEK